MHKGLWAAKDPNEKKDYGFNWAGTADDPGLAYNDALLSSTWDVPVGLTIFSQSFDTQKTTLWLTGGIAGETYLITNHVVTAGGRNYDESIKLKCKNK